MSVHDLINRFARAEQQFRAGEFLAPVVQGGTVLVRIAGLQCQFHLRGLTHGWGIFRPQGTLAKLVRSASLLERQRYLNLFPQRPMLLVAPHEHSWLAWPVQQADTRFGRPTLVPVRLAEDVQLFERVVARFDGVQGWFESADARADPTTARYLREAYHAQLPPELLRRPRLTAEERTAYCLAVDLRRVALRDRTEERLRMQLAHAGADYYSHVEQEQTVRIEFAVDGQRHVSVVHKDDFSVQLAGICLNGEDQQFDLASLVGVLREADDALRIGAENEGLAEEQYWAIHPPHGRPHIARCGVE